MSDKLLAIGLRTPQEQIAALIRERDEALAEAKHWVSISVLSSIDGMIEEIEKRARAKAIDEAAAVYETRGAKGMEWDVFSSAVDAILALKEKP